MLRKISAQYIFRGNGPPLKRGVIVINEKGVIIDLIDTQGNLQETSHLEFYNGIITPGFINAHVHLELSHLRGKVGKQKGLVDFISNINKIRNYDYSATAILNADNEMLRYGIVAASDIANTDLTFQIKTSGRIKYFTFIEIFGVQNKDAKEKLKQGISLLDELKRQGLPGSITPHAPYSVSDQLWLYITEYAKKERLPWSVHNQENSDENKLFLDKTGKFAEFIYHISDEFQEWPARGITSLKHCLPFYMQIPKVLLVHNTFTSADDLSALKNLKGKIVFVLCPNSNLYIEDRLPDIEMLRNSGHLIAIGTDSLASNTKLSVLEELKTIQRHFPQVSLQELIAWGTINGAEALGLQSNLGSIQIGKKPGLNLVTNINFEAMTLTSQSEVQVLTK